MGEESADASLRKLLPAAAFAAQVGFEDGFIVIAAMIALGIDLWPNVWARYRWRQFLVDFL